MDVELEPRVKPLSYKIKAMSRESASQKAHHVLDPDLRSHWSTATNTKEWILLELDEPCLLSHIRIYNKSVLEWEIGVGLRYKPEAFVKVRPRCEAPRRDVVYHMNYTPCRYVRISCLRGNPIAIFFIQLIGVSVTGLEPEFQPVVNYLLPQIISHKQDAHDMHLQLLQDMTIRLLPFLPQLESDLMSFSETAVSSIRFLAMLAGPFYPILHIINERESTKTSGSSPDSDSLRNSQTPTLTVSSNFEAQPRRSRSPSPFIQPASSSIAFLPDAVFILLRKAYKDPQLGIVCRTASRALQKLIEPGTSVEAPIPLSDSASSSVSADTAKPEGLGHLHLADYSSLFGEEFRIPNDNWDANFLNVLDLSAVEEGILHVLYACASQHLQCCKLSESSSDVWSALPLVQAFLPALRPPSTSPSDQFDDSLWQWKQPFVQQALSQIVGMVSSSVYRPLLHACAGYLSSFQPSHAKAACILIDLCSGPLAPWMSTVIPKVDLAIEILEDFLGTIQNARHSFSRAALKYLILALSGHMDDILAKYKEVKHRLLFLVEMLDPFLDPAITAVKNTIAFGDVSAIFREKQEHNCAVALDIIRTAIQRPAVLPSLEAEWRRGSVAPSVLLSILGPHMPLPAEIDHCKCPISKEDEETSTNSVLRSGIACKNNSQDEADGKADAPDLDARMDVCEDSSLLFLPLELKSTMLSCPNNLFEGSVANKVNSESSIVDISKEGKRLTQKTINNQFQSSLILDTGFAVEYFNLQADYLQLVNHQDCELRASEFQRLASELHSQHDLTPEGHDAAIDALLLAAECYVNPFFMTTFRETPKLFNRMNLSATKIPQKYDATEIQRFSERCNNDLEMIAHLESKRDKTVLQILLEAAKMDREYQKIASNREQCQYYMGEDEQVIEISSLEMDCADAVTLVRQNQALLCQFVIKRLNKEQQSMHEILMQSLLFLLHSATQLFCPPDNVVDIILTSAGHLNGLLTSFYYQLKEGNLQLDPERVHGVQRRWVLLQRLVIASSGCGGDGTYHATKSQSGFQYQSLIPPYTWIQRISKFVSSPFPLVRFVGWMAISQHAKQYINERLFLTSDLTQLTSLLSIFADELALMDNLVDNKDELSKVDHFVNKKFPEHSTGFGPPEQAYGEGSCCIIYPDLHTFFPNMKRQFRGFGEIILEAVGIELKSLSSSAVPDALCWFSDFCVWPFHDIIKDQSGSGNTPDHLKGYSAKNTKAIILYILEAIMSVHMEAMLPEIPRVMQILVSLCRSSYCDAAFLGSILSVLKPLISYALGKASEDEKLLEDESSCLNLESSCFSELLSNIRCRSEYQNNHTEKTCQGALVIFVLGALFSDLSSRRRGEILQSTLLWADFATTEPTSSFYDYLCGFQNLMESCQLQLVQALEISGILVADQKHHIEGKTIADASSSFPSYFLDDAHKSQQTEDTEEFKKVKNDVTISNHRALVLYPNEIEEFSKGLQQLISKLYPSIELCWKIHPQLAKKLTLTSAKCYMYSSCLSSIAKISVIGKKEGENAITSVSGDQLATNWSSALEVLVGVVLLLQQNHCWQVSSVIVDYLLGLPHQFCLDYVISALSSAIKNFSCHAPRISWRLQTDKWLSALFSRGISNLHGEEASLIDLFETMLGHSEPEQRSVAVNQLARLVGHNIRIGTLSYTVKEKSVPSEAVPESIVSLLVSSTWDKIAAMASSDPSMLLRTQAMVVLLDCIPFAQRGKLQSFLEEAEVILCGLGNLAFPMREGPLTQLSLALLAGACLYSPAEDITLIPESVWRNLETIGMSKSEGSVGDIEKRACQALCRLRIEGDDAKEDLKEALSLNSATEHIDPNFGSTRESILQILSTLTSAQSYFDFFLEKMDQEAMELEEAEIELDLIQKEKALQDVSGGSREEVHCSPRPQLSAHLKGASRLQEIKDEICSLEKSRLKEEIAARRQKKLLVKRTRQKYLEEAALRETERLKELDRERTSEMEREIERQQQLEVERAKTRELRHNLDMERERQTQRDLQRELEQAESGIRPSRREFSSTSSGRPRERFRERENGRTGHEASLRPSSRGRDGGAASNSAAGSSGAINSMPTVVLSGSRSFSGQPPTILQSRDRSEDRSGAYEDNLDGSRDSGDTGSIGDPDLSSAFDGPAGGFGSTQRQGSRSSKSRQIMERRERDGRREGKWERKHS